MDTRALFESLNFEQDWAAMTDQLPAYSYDFGNLRLNAAQVMSVRFTPCFYLGGTYRTSKTLGVVEFEMPLEVESFEQGVAWLAHGLGRKFEPRIPTLWLADGRSWKDHLPWERDRKAYAARPQCSVEKDWFRMAVRKLKEAAKAADDHDLAHISFDGEILRFSVRDTTVPMPAAGTAWNDRYAIRASQLEQLPVRLNSFVHVSLWEGRLNIGNRVWTTIDPIELEIGEAT